MARIDAEQKERLIDNGLSVDYNPTIAKLLLSANHDMREKSDQTQQQTGTIEVRIRKD